LTEEVTIAGGGLAGLSLAAGLRRRGVPVAVHEAGAYPRHRVCGEFISGVGGETLAALGIADCLDDARRHRHLAWFLEDKRIYEGELREPALGISRYRVDQRLKNRVVELGGVVREQSRLPRVAREGLVWTTGRFPQRGGWIGLKCHFDELPMIADLEMHLGENGYAGLAGIEDGRVNVCGLFRVDRSFRFKGPELLLTYLARGGNEALVDRLRRAHADVSSCQAVAGFELGRQPAGDGECVLGDAESMIAPFTGNGMSMAFQGAELALDPLEDWSRGKLPWDTCVAAIRDRLRVRFRRRLFSASLMQPVLLHRGGRKLLESLSRSGLLPFHPLLSLVR
jgi:flavin-dependent dehydrogenase